MTLKLFVLFLKDINYELYITNLSQFVNMGVPCYTKVLIFALVLLLIDLTNFTKAENYKDKVYNYDSYDYPGYEYPDSRSKYIHFFHACTDYFTTSPKVLPIWQLGSTDGRVP